MRTWMIVLGGAATGAGLAYLCSPAGEPARRKIREKATWAAYRTEQCLTTTAQTLAVKAEEGKQLATHLIEEGQEIAQQAGW